MDILKTVKMFVGGKYIRSESGATAPFYRAGTEEEVARVCMASRKDFRNAVEIAKPAASTWKGATAYNKSQILYRMAEMAQAKESEFINVLLDTMSLSEAEVMDDVQAMIDTFVYYAGWCDKYQQLIGSVNPVAAPYHNFSTPDNMGVVVHIDNDEFSLSRLVDNICAILVGGNSVISLVSKNCSPIVTTLGEVFQTSDLPSGVVNLLSGDLGQLLPHISTHMEVNAISFQNENEELYFKLRSDSVDNMKRIIPFKNKKLSLDLILDFVEMKTVWHPIGY